MPLLLLLEEVEESLMPFQTDRGAIRLRWGGASTERAFRVQKRDYGGGDQLKPATYRRNVRTGAMLRTFGNRLRSVDVNLLVREDPGTDQISGVDEGSIDELESAWKATDLECLSFEDTAYWYAEWIGPWPPRLEFDTMRTWAVIPMKLEQRTTS